MSIESIARHYGVKVAQIKGHAHCVLVFRGQILPGYYSSKGAALKAFDKIILDRLSRHAVPMAAKELREGSARKRKKNQYDPMVGAGSGNPRNDSDPNDDDE